MYSILAAPFSFRRAYLEATAAVVLFPSPRTPSDRKQVCHISRFLIAYARSRTEEITIAVRLVSTSMTDLRMVNRVEVGQGYAYEVMLGS